MLLTHLINIEKYFGFSKLINLKTYLNSNNPWKFLNKYNQNCLSVSYIDKFQGQTK